MVSLSWGWRGHGEADQPRVTPLDMHLLPALPVEFLESGTRSLPTLPILGKLARVLESDDGMETPNPVQTRAAAVRSDMKKYLQSV